MIRSNGLRTARRIEINHRNEYAAGNDGDKRKSTTVHTQRRLDVAPLRAPQGSVTGLVK